MILPKVRDPRFITLRRGGTLTDADHHLLARLSLDVIPRLPMQTIEFNGWVLEVDRGATEAAYAEVVASSTAECRCADCLRFDARRSELLHPAARALFRRLGVEEGKEIDLTNFGPDANGLDIWDWLYPFVGRIVSAPVKAESNGQTAFSSLSADFALGFSEQATLVGEPFHKRGPVVQAECFYYEGNAARAAAEPS
ncbi:MAG TPA: hypothetical protein VK610_08980 [Rhodothermales bacterium]|nr:hypothetical protein [Rhodothermales bacterium]